MNNVKIEERRQFTTEEIKKIQSNIKEIKNFLIDEVIPYILKEITVEFGHRYILTINKNQIILTTIGGGKAQIFLEGEGTQEFDIHFLSEKFWEQYRHWNFHVNYLYDLLLNWKNKDCIKDELVQYIERRKIENEILNNFQV